MQNAYTSSRCNGPARFWAAVSKKGPTRSVLGRCWKWLRPLDKDGYGEIMVRRRKYKAHQYAWVLLVGELPNGVQVLHKCDNPSCTNPDHLFLGTNRDNTADKVRKSRQAKGEDFRSAKLTKKDVIRIRKRYRYGSQSNGTVAIAREYGVSNVLVGMVVKRKAWKHIQ